MKRKDVEKALVKAVLALAINDGFKPVKGDSECITKEVTDGVQWRLRVTLYNRKPIYSIMAFMSCEYSHASKAIESFLEENNLKDSGSSSVGFFSSLGKHVKDNFIQHVSVDNIDETAFELYERFKEGAEVLLAPRVDQKVAVEEYLTKRPQHWPGGDLKQCCLTILSYGLLHNDVSLMKKGIERVFEVLALPNDSQRDREFYESLRDVVEKL